MARKPVSAATKLKISRALKGNKNAFAGGPKKNPLSTRQKIANINAATRAKKANLSSDQIARRAAVAKRLRAQARREEALGGGNPGTIKTNADELSATLAKSDRLKQGGLEAMKSAKSADEIRAATAKIKEARNALKEGAPRNTRKESQAKVQPKARQNLNAPQTPPEQQKARIGEMSASTRRRQQASKFEADQAKARASQLQTNSRGEIVQRGGGNATTNDLLRAYAAKKSDGPVPGHDAKSVQGRPANIMDRARSGRMTPAEADSIFSEAARKRADEARAKGTQVRPSDGNLDLVATSRGVFSADVFKPPAGKASSDNVVAPGSRKSSRKADPLKSMFKEWEAQDRKLATLKKREETARAKLSRAESARKARGSRIQSNAELRARENLQNATNAVFDLQQQVNQRREQPQPPQSVTGSDRTGTFTKEVPVTGEKKTSTKTGLIETQADYEDFAAKAMPEIIKRLSKNIPSEDMKRMTREAYREAGLEPPD